MCVCGNSGRRGKCGLMTFRLLKGGSCGRFAGISDFIEARHSNRYMRCVFMTNCKYKAPFFTKN